MKTISSKWTFFMKTIFPIFWFGFLAVFVIVLIGTNTIYLHFMLWVIPLLLATLGFILMKVLIWGVMDEVIDCGDYLIVKYRGQEDKIPLSNIININWTTYQNPTSITLRLKIAGKFGQTISFFPVTHFGINRFKTHPLAEELIMRVDAARYKHSGVK